MTVRNGTARSRPPRRNHGEQLKDEVYRQMFRLEEGRPGAGQDRSAAFGPPWAANRDMLVFCFGDTQFLYSSIFRSNAWHAFLD